MIEWVVFCLENGKMVLIEIVLGVDLEKDIFG